MIFNADINGIKITVEAENKRAAFLKCLESFNSSWDKETKMYYLSTMSDAEFEKMVESHPYIRLEINDDDSRE